MPNWCNNTLTIRGDFETLSQLKPVIEAGEGLLQAIRPMPPELEGTTAPNDSPNWYDWCVENWGTKWDVECHLEFVDNGDGTAEIHGWFDSAWAPPITAMHELAEDWDSAYIELMYHEPGMSFVGCWDSEGADDHYDYESADDIPDYLDEHFGIREQQEMWDEEIS